MPRESANRLVAFLKEQAGDYLRGAVHYSEDDYRVLYLREDVDRLYPEAKLDDLFDYYRRRNREEKADTPFELGGHHCTTRFYDEAILFHFTQSDSVGTVVTLSPEAGRNVVTFITQCLRVLHDDSPQPIKSAPTWLRDDSA